MALATGTRLGPYEILSPLGAGGMGEVYRARDTRLNRDVAIKVLPEHLSTNPELRERFEREARAISQLSHPHICVLHDIGQHEGADYLVLGSLTKIGDDIRLDAHLIGIAEEGPPMSAYGEQKSIDDLMVKIDNFARAIGDRFGWAPSEPDTKAPIIITNSYAAEKGRYGTIWKIYIEVQATEAEIIRIAAKVDQPGQGRYPIHYISLKPPYRKYLKGYLQWNTFSSKTNILKEGTQLTLGISAIDKEENRSKEVFFPFSFESGVKDQATLPPPFDQGDIPRLGYIGIDLVNPDRGR